VKILFDQNVPRPLVLFFTGHEVRRAAELGWQEFSNGDLIASAEAHGFQVLVTADKNLRYQQNLRGRKLAIVILPSGLWPRIRPRVSEVVEAVERAKAGSLVEITPG
jgi:ribosomal protein L1